MGMLRLHVCSCIVAAQFSLGFASEVLKIGAIFHDTGVGAKAKPVLKLFEDWANDNETDDTEYTVETIVKTYSSATLAADVSSLTTGANKVDVLFCPYTSGASSACAAAVSDQFTGPIMIWGGASDSIYATDGPCAGKHCFGFFTVASKYMEAGLNAVLEVEADVVQRTAVICNNNPFSRSVAAAVNATIENQDNLVLQSYTALATEKSLEAAGVAQVKDAMSLEPAAVVISGHSGDVDQVVIEISKSSKKPKFILATNGLTNLQPYLDAGGKPHNCILMPEQWAKNPDVKDPVIGWTTAAFQSALDGDATTYHSAAAGAAMVAIANAMSENSTNLASSMAALDIKSFYGDISFKDGKIQKPMYMVQWQDDAMVVVAPTAAAAGTLKPYGCSGDFKEDLSVGGAFGATSMPLAVLVALGLVQLL